MALGNSQGSITSGKTYRARMILLSEELDGPLAAVARTIDKWKPEPSLDIKERKPQENNHDKSQKHWTGSSDGIEMHKTIEHLKKSIQKP
jgi:hypothetical protein